MSKNVLESESVLVRRLEPITIKSLSSLFLNEFDSNKELEKKDNFLLHGSYIDKKQLKKARNETYTRIGLLKSRKNNYDKIQQIAEHENWVKMNMIEANDRFNEYLRFRKRQETERKSNDSEYRVRTIPEKKEKDYLGLAKRVAEEKERKSMALRIQLAKKYNFLETTKDGLALKAKRTENEDASAKLLEEARNYEQTQNKIREESKAKWRAEIEALRLSHEEAKKQYENRLKAVKQRKTVITLREQSICNRFTRCFSEIELRPILLYSENLNRTVANNPKHKSKFEKFKKTRTIDQQKNKDQLEKEIISKNERIQMEEAQRIERIKKEMALKESLLEFENKLKMFDYVLTLYTK